MEGSDRSTEGLDLKEFRERVARRKLLLGAAALGGGSILISQANTSQSNSEKHLAEAETRLVELAATINGTNLVDPRQTLGLHNDVAEAVESVNDALNQSLPDKPETEQQVSALRTATEYYSALATTLDTATNLLAQVADSELTVLNHERPLGYDPANEFSTDILEEAIARLTEAEKAPDTVTSQGRKLVPNQQQVINSLRAQRDVFDRHIAAQQIYFDTATAVEDGVRAHEKSRFDAAKSKLTEARESMTTGISKMDYSYRLSNVGLSLDQYTTVFRLRREGVSKLLSVCDGSVPVQRRRSVANTALDTFFEARQIVTD